MNRIHHEPSCPKRLGLKIACTCAGPEDEMIETFTRVPVGPYQSLATMIRSARTQGILKPLQPYGGGTAPTP